jgi:ABC-type nickel/cobalt efflux system permease component RcnA
MALGGTRSFAHPLGNFTINHLARITATGDALHVRYILDIAEIPTFQIMHEPGGANWAAHDMRAWVENESSIVQSGLQISVDGEPLPLRVVLAQARLRPGAGGLPIIRWVGVFTGSIATGLVHHITVTDNVYSDRRIGWKDIVVGLQREPTNELRRYPSALIGTPRRIDTATFTLEPNAKISRLSEREDARPVSGTVGSWVSPTALSDMFSGPNQTPLFIALTLLAAFGLGALHAIEPGHGKALLAFTLVGARATTKQAFILAWSLTVAHTAGVLLLGAVLFFTAGFVSESIYPWITLLSGIIIAVIGARALTAFFRTLRGSSTHLHSHEHHGAHPHSEEHHHSHDIPGSQPLRFRTAVWAAMSGGIAPCPAAIVVLLAALRLHEIGYGIVLIVVFSMGLASVLSGIGIGVVHGAAWLSRQSAYARFAQYGPLVTSIVICTIGAWTVGLGLGQQGVSVPVPLLAAITLAAIAGYAFSHTTHVHRHHAAATQLS